GRPPARDAEDGRNRVQPVDGLRERDLDLFVAGSRLAPRPSGAPGRPPLSSAVQPPIYALDRAAGNGYSGCSTPRGVDGKSPDHGYRGRPGTAAGQAAARKLRGVRRRPRRMGWGPTGGEGPRRRYPQEEVRR